MKIGLVGAPGAGKSDFARQLARALEAQGGRYQPVVVVDDYVQEVEERMDMGTGFLGSYVTDVAIAFERYGRERQAVRDGAETVITCGTLAETSTYTAINLTLLQSEWAWAVSNVAMPYYQLLSRNFMDYDHVFVRPSEPENDLDMALDREMFGALQALRVNYVFATLDEAVDIVTGAA